MSCFMRRNISIAYICMHSGLYDYAYESPHSIHMRSFSHIPYVKEMEIYGCYSAFPQNSKQKESKDCLSYLNRTDTKCPPSISIHVVLLLAHIHFCQTFGLITLKNLRFMAGKTRENLSTFSASIDFPSALRPCRFGCTTHSQFPFVGKPKSFDVFRLLKYICCFINENLLIKTQSTMSNGFCLMA